MGPWGGGVSGCHSGFRSQWLRTPRLRPYRAHFPPNLVRFAPGRAPCPKLRWVDRNGERANGSGQWKSGSGGAYAGKRFRISMGQQGKSLSMAMAVGSECWPTG